MNQKSLWAAATAALIGFGCGGSADQDVAAPGSGGSIVSPVPEAPVFIPGQPSTPTETPPGSPIAPPVVSAPGTPSVPPVPTNPPSPPTPVAPPATPLPPQLPTDSDYAATPRAVDAQPLSTTEVMVSWKDVTDNESGFVVERRRNGTSVWTKVMQTPPNLRLFRDASLAPQTEYEYRVSALRPIGVSVPSKPVLASLPALNKPSVFFVDPAGENTYPGTEERPWKTLQHAHSQLKPGQTVLIRGGTYQSDAYAVLAITQSGSPKAPITYKAFPGEQPVIKSTVGKNWHGVEIRHASHIVVDGLTLQGHSSSINLQGAMAEMMNPSSYATSSGISVESRDDAKPISSFIEIRNNTVFDHPCQGISIMGADYVTVEYNRTFNNGRYSSYGCSGISLYQARNLDQNTASYKLVVRGNYSYSNINEVPCGCFDYKAVTDGNGIIVDLFKASNYAGRTLIENNVVHDNGGRGIHVFKSLNVDVFFNTAILNSTVKETGDGEITAIESSNVRVFNNIMVARADRPSNSIGKSDNVAFDYNIVDGGMRFSSTGHSGNRLGVNPKIASYSGAGAFKLQGDSPAANSALTGVTAPALDFYRAPRTRGVLPDIGAVESH